MRILHLTIFFIVGVATDASFATDQKQFSRACDQLITSGTPHGRKIGELYRGDWYASDDAVAVMPISRRQLTDLIQNGVVEDDEGVLINPVAQHPLIATWLHENPQLNANATKPEDLPVTSAVDAWAHTLADIFEDRTARTNAKIFLERCDLIAMAYEFHGQHEAGETFSPKIEFIAQLAYAAELATDEHQLLRCKLSRDLSRRLNMGSDESDLRRWNLLRAAAETFRVPWSFDPPGPTLERALESYFARLPRFAGAMLVLNERVLPRIDWSETEPPRLTRVTLGEIIKIDSLGEIEDSLLGKLGAAVRSGE